MKAWNCSQHRVATVAQLKSTWHASCLPRSATASSGISHFQPYLASGSASGSPEQDTRHSTPVQPRAQRSRLPVIVTNVTTAGLGNLDTSSCFAVAFNETCCLKRVASLPVHQQLIQPQSHLSQRLPVHVSIPAIRYTLLMLLPVWTVCLSQWKCRCYLQEVNVGHAS